MFTRNNSARFIFVFLGMLTAFGPFVTDMYLPSLPAMTSFFDTSISMVQMGLTFSMLGLALGQLFFGPLSDKYGRRKPLLGSMLLFAFSTLACIFSPNIIIFVGLRFLQGIAASGGIVIARSIATDKFKGANLAKALAIVGAINGIAPIVAPVIGGFVVNSIGWRGIFVCLLFLGCFLLIASLWFNESLSHARRSKDSLSKVFTRFWVVLQNKTYVFYTLELSFALAILFAYIASSPFIIQNIYGFSALGFSLFFAVNAVALGGGAAFAVKFKSQEQGLKISVWGINICCCGLLVAMPFHVSIFVYETLLLLLSFMLGISFTLSTATAMNSARENAGTASAILGAGGFLLGSIVSPLVGMGNILVSAGCVMMFCAVCAGVCARKGQKAASQFDFSR